MAREPTTYSEWRSRRNNIAMTLCSAVHRARGEVCGCYNGDEDPDKMHFDSCRRNIEVADRALTELGVPIPAKPDR